MDIMSFSLKHCQRKASLSQKKIKRGEAWVAHLKNCCLQLCKKSHFRTDVHSNYPPLHFSVLIVTGHTNMTNCQPAFSHLNSLYFFICILFFVFGFPFAKLETFAFLSLQAGTCWFGPKKLSSKCVCWDLRNIHDKKNITWVSSGKKAVLAFLQN